MASLEISLVDELSPTGGWQFNNKVFPMNAVELTPAPYIVYSTSFGQADKTLKGFLTSKKVTCEINMICNDYASMRDITSEVIPRLQSFARRTIGTRDPIFVQDIELDDPVELYEYEVKKYRCTLGFTIYL
jgi:hypothetical protein